MAPWLLSLLGKSAYSNLRSLQPERKLTAINIYLQQRYQGRVPTLTKLDIYQITTFKQIGHTKVQGTWQNTGTSPEGEAMRMWDLSQLSLKVHGHWGEFLKTARNQMVTPVFREDLENYIESTLFQSLRKGGDGEKNVEAICKHLKDRKMIGSYQHGFTKGISCLPTW